ncbi:hypothetical protein K402DRAFT_402471 [Aulographum hederae CBS 113979]|uniref:Uncharacterized protein n=1 Tax=Aulographum hederae CBS 113979 TaxID=1176131 RepID=A0A6G1H6S3_9PEZI|nr:hypothetical protein K402DRAFT_402471 [Aulographum hederae CBS 113979]
MLVQLDDLRVAIEGINTTLRNQHDRTDSEPQCDPDDLRVIATPIQNILNSAGSFISNSAPTIHAQMSYASRSDLEDDNPTTSIASTIARIVGAASVAASSDDGTVCGTREPDNTANSVVGVPLPGIRRTEIGFCASASRSTLTVECLVEPMSALLADELDSDSETEPSQEQAILTAAYRLFDDGMFEQSESLLRSAITRLFFQSDEGALEKHVSTKERCQKQSQLSPSSFRPSKMMTFFRYNCLDLLATVYLRKIKIDQALSCSKAAMKGRKRIDGVECKRHCHYVLTFVSICRCIGDHQTANIYLGSLPPSNSSREDPTSVQTSNQDRTPEDRMINSILGEAATSLARGDEEKFLSELEKLTKGIRSEYCAVAIKRRSKYKNQRDWEGEWTAPDVILLGLPKAEFRDGDSFYSGWVGAVLLRMSIPAHSASLAHRLRKRFAPIRHFQSEGSIFTVGQASALCLAIWADDPAAVQLALDLGGNIYEKNEVFHRYRTPPLEAVRKKNSEVLELLLEHVHKSVLNDTCSALSKEARRIGWHTGHELIQSYGVTTTP